MLMFLLNTIVSYPPPPTITHLFRHCLGLINQICQDEKNMMDKGDLILRKFVLTCKVFKEMVAISDHYQLFSLVVIFQHFL